MSSNFIARVDARDFKVGIFGLGYVGLPLAFAFVGKGFETVGFDIDTTKIEAISQKKSYMRHIPDSAVAASRDTGLFHATSDFSQAVDMDALLLCVPTPLTPQREPEMSYIVKTAEAILPYLRKGQIVCLESTTYPGTTDGLLREIMERSGLKAGEDFHLAYSPEREDPGNASFSTAKIPKVVGGLTPTCTEYAHHLYAQIVPAAVTVSSCAAAEAVKLTENIFRAVNIALVNELKVVYQKMGIDVWEVIEAAKTKPFGYMPFYPGPGLGGHCIPIDPFYLTWKAREFGCATKFIELAGEVNVSMPHYVMDRLSDALNNHEKSLKNSRILLLGVAYKKDVDDMRESPGLILIEMLRAKGADVIYHDPFVLKIGPTREHASLTGMVSTDLTPELLRGCDAVLIATDHSTVDYAMVVAESKLVVDTRNVTSGIEKPEGRVVKA